MAKKYIYSIRGGNAKMTDINLEPILDIYGPQFGEMIWHSLHLDDSIVKISSEYANRMLDLIHKYELMPVDRPIRILEIGAYAHFGVPMVCSMLNVTAHGWVHDVSPTSLRLGAAEATKLGFPSATLVAGDFHDLPFNTGYFDLVFCASSIHHTFRPWRVLSEMMRVVRPGGVVRVENEPVGRQFCFYQFRGNRTESRTEFEKQIEQVGLMWTVSSPFPGSRPEALFGMIENDRIPLSTYIDTLSEVGNIDVLEIIPQVAEFDRLILDLTPDCSLSEKIYNELAPRLVELKKHINESDKLLGFDLPSTDRVWLLSYQIAERLRSLESTDGDVRTRGMADLFGATLRATVVKFGNGQYGAEKPLVRELPLQREVLVDLPQLQGINLELTNDLLPEIESGSREVVEAIYPSSDWIYFDEPNGLHTLLNKGDTGHIPLPLVSRECLMLVRFYAVAENNCAPYVVRFMDTADNVLSEHVICQSESCLGRFLIPSMCDAVTMKLSDLDGGCTQDFHCFIHLAVARLVPITSA
jgi:SAM-dependent methyltransferase